MSHTQPTVTAVSPTGDGPEALGGLIQPQPGYVTTIWPLVPAMSMWSVVAAMSRIQSHVTEVSHTGDGPEALGGLIESLLEEPGLRAALGRAARERLRRCCDLARFGRDYLALYRAVARHAL